MPLLIGLHALKQEVIDRMLPVGGSPALLASTNAFTNYNTFAGTPPNYSGLITATAYHTTNSFINVLNFTGIVNNNTLTSGFSQLYGMDGYVQIRATTANSYNRTIAGGRFFISYNATSPYEAKSLSGYGIIIDPPSILGTGTKTPGTISGIYIQNQGVSGTTTTKALEILDQSGSTNNYAIYTGAGNIRLMSSASDKLGFHGTAPIAQQLLATGAGATADNIITVLQNLGLCRQS
jgi:hypothetical protein